MPRICTVCACADLEAINKAIVCRESKRGIARRFGVSPDAVERHAADHLPKTLQKAAETREVTHAGDLVGTLERGLSSVIEVLEHAHETDNWGGVLQAADRLPKIGWRRAVRPAMPVTHTTSSAAWSAASIFSATTSAREASSWRGLARLDANMAVVDRAARDGRAAAIRAGPSCASENERCEWVVPLSPLTPGLFVMLEKKFGSVKDIGNGVGLSTCPHACAGRSKSAARSSRGIS